MYNRKQNQNIQTKVIFTLLNKQMRKIQIWIVDRCKTINMKLSLEKKMIQTWLRKSGIQYIYNTSPLKNKGNLKQKRSKK